MAAFCVTIIYVDPWQADFRMENHSFLNELPVSKTAALTEHAGSAAGANPLRSPSKKKHDVSEFLVAMFVN